MQPLPEKPPIWFYDLTDVEKWQYARNFSLIAVDFAQQIKGKIEVNGTYQTQLKKNTKFLENYKPFYPKFGAMFNVKFDVDRNLQPDMFIGCDLLLFLFKGRFIISPGFDIKIYNEFGGGLKLGFGFAT
jgi:hypothetical protein